MLTIEECLQPTVPNAYTCVSRSSDSKYIHVGMILLIFTSHHNNHILMRNMTSNEAVFLEMNYETHIGSGYRCGDGKLLNMTRMSFEISKFKGTLKRYVTEMKFMRAIREEACIARAQAINLVLTFRKIDEYYTSQVFCVHMTAKTAALADPTGPSLLDQINLILM